VPIAIGAAAIDGIAFGLIAIAVATLVTAYVISPLRAGAQQVSGLVAVGGALSFALSRLADLIQITINANSYLVSIGRQQAMDWFNWIVTGIVSAYYGGAINAATWLAANLGAVAWMRNYWDAYWSVVFGEIRPAVGVLQNDLGGLHRWIDTAELPLIRGIGDDLAGLHRWIDGVQLPLIRGIGDDLAGLHRWLDGTLVPGIDAGIRQLADAWARTNADVQTRARQAEVDALKQELARTQATVATLAALLPLAIAGAEVISNLRCVGNINCLDLNALNDGTLSTLESRVAMLEVAGD